ncbi:MAG TPA: DUF2953 domain-containing protein [Symbiobacteriaceae bacterium]
MLAIIVIALLAPVLWFLPLGLGLAFSQDEWQVNLRLSFRAGFIRLERSLNLTEQAKPALAKLVEQWRETGRPDYPQVPKAIAKADWDAILRVVIAPVRYYLRHLACRNLQLQVELGGFDAMQSALLAGASWSVVGMVLSFVREALSINVLNPHVAIRPRFDAPTVHTRLNCILQIRLGHAIVAGVWLLGRAARSRDVRAWVRNSRRRKGVAGSGRTSD